jgi:hypothetical protein
LALKHGLTVPKYSKLKDIYKLGEAGIIKIGPSTTKFTAPKIDFPPLAPGGEVHVISSTMSEEQMQAHEHWRHTLTTAEQQAISSWKGSARTIRAEVAAGQMSSKTKAFISGITKEAPYEGVIFRGIHNSSNTNYADQLRENIKQVGVGGDFIDPSPHCCSLSCSTGHGFSHGELMLRIKSKTSRPIWKEDGCTSEKEIVGMAGAHYKITGFKEHTAVKSTNGQLGQVKMFCDLEEV